MFVGQPISDILMISCICNTNKNKSKNETIDPNYVTGFCDGESCFKILVRKNSLYKSGYSVSTRFSIILHKNDKELLKKIQAFFGVGKIKINK